MKRMALLLAALATVATMSTARPVQAIIGLDDWHWSVPGYTLSESSYSHSNITGFWQTILFSFGCGMVYVDGIFGPLTTGATHDAQVGLGLAASGSVDLATWAGTQQAQYWDPVDAEVVDRLYFTGFVDGFGTQHFTYYGGGSSPAVLGWNPFTPAWLFAQDSFSAPTALTQATVALTIGSFQCSV